MGALNMDAIIVLYNSKSVILQCLSSLNCASGAADISCNVYCVDNQPELSWPNLSILIDYPHLKIFPIKSDTNSGFSGGCKLAIEKYSLSQNVLLLNPDAFVMQDFFQKLSHDIVKYRGSDNLLIGTRAVSIDGSSPTRNAGSMPELFAYKNHNVIAPNKAFYGSTIWPLAACLFIKSNDNFSELFDMPFFLTLEEPYLVRNLKDVVVAFSEATVIHEGGHSYSSNTDELVFHVQALKKYRYSFSFSLAEKLKLFLAITKLDALILLRTLF